jgi:hypothetical protein
MGRGSPGMAGGVALISWISRFRAVNGDAGGAGLFGLDGDHGGVKVMVPARPRMIVWRMVARYSSSSRR